MTAPGWREQAWQAFREYPGTGRDALAAALDAAEPLIRAEADSRRIPGSEMYMAGAAAERERIRQLATERGAVYCARERVSGRCTCLSGRAEAVPFAYLIRGDGR